MSIQRTPDARDLRYLKLVVGRKNGDTEEEIAKSAGESSPTLLYQRINEDGHPICPKCGATYVSETHCEGRSADKGSSERRAQASGPTTELPPAGNAIPLFREKLEALARGNEGLINRTEELQDGRLFVESRVWPDNAYVNLAGLSEDEKQLLAPALADDSESGAWLTNGIPFNVGGGTSAPSAPLPALIAAYFLMEGKIEPLLDALKACSPECIPPA